MAGVIREGFDPGFFCACLSPRGGGGRVAPSPPVEPDAEAAGYFGPNYPASSDAGSGRFRVGLGAAPAASGPRLDHANRYFASSRRSNVRTASSLTTWPRPLSSTMTVRGAQALPGLR